MQDDAYRKEQGKVRVVLVVVNRSDDRGCAYFNLARRLLHEVRDHVRGGSVDLSVRFERRRRSVGILQHRTMMVSLID